MAGLEIWQQELQQLRTTARSLSGAMTRAAMELRDDGAEPPDGLLQQMQQFRSDFRRLRECIVEERSSERGVPSSLNDLAVELQHREDLRTVLELVDRAAGLQTRVGETPSPLLERWHGEVQRTRKALETEPNTTEVMQLLRTGRHPLVVAMRLAEGADELTDDAWSEAMETVSSTLGRDLATALARGRLFLGQPVVAQSIHELT